MLKNILISLLSAVLLSLPWLGAPGYILLFAFVPLLFLQKKLEGKRGFIRYAVLTFLLWSVMTVFWVINATMAGSVALLVNTFVSTIAFAAYHYVWKRGPKALAYTVFATAWITMEYVYLNGQLSFPWLLLGNGFANNVEAIQWYEYTGVLGGSLWVLISNLVIFEAIEAYRKGRWNVVMVTPALVIFVPIITSLIIYYNYRESENKIKVEVIQPNIDPYGEKFSAMSQHQQTDIILSLAMNAPQNVDYIVTPETSFEDRIFENYIIENSTIVQLQDFMKGTYPGSTLIAGATTFKIYKSEHEATHTAHNNQQGGYWYDVFNTALQIDSSSVVGIYHKSKLVAGAEMMPFSRQLKYLRKFSLDLGGVMGELGYENERSVFVSKNGVKVGVAICYESVYGEYATDYVKKGAQSLFIITNDGWWGDTPGYRQHFSYARLRAIENRRSIARSANTGISGFIDQRGDVISKTKWDERCSQYGEINLNDKITFYTEYGDYIGRLSVYVLALSFLYYIAYKFRKKSLF